MTAPDPWPLTTPIERQVALNIGAVEAVAPGRISVRLELDAPQATALNTGSPVAFPRLNSFVVVPNEIGALVGIVVWLGIEHSSYPKRPGLKDFGLVDLPFPVRKMSVVPVGTLERCLDKNRRRTVRLRRGVVAFPSVGDPVALPSAEQLDALTRGEPEDRRVHIGRALLGNDARICIDPDKLFGRHLAILGNTGSGKSCSVAGLIRWSLAAAQREVRERTPNSRFIVLDPNGEYRQALGDLPGFRLFLVPPVETADADPLRVPAWLLNSHEWSSVTVASARMQRPVLTQALRNLRLGLKSTASDDERLAAIGVSYLVSISGVLNSGANYWAHEFPGRMSTGGLLESMRDTVAARLDPAKPWHPSAKALVDVLDTLVSSMKNEKGYWGAFNEPQLTDVIKHLVPPRSPAPSDVRASRQRGLATPLRRQPAGRPARHRHGIRRPRGRGEVYRRLEDAHPLAALGRADPANPHAGRDSVARCLAQRVPRGR